MPSNEAEQPVAETCVTRVDTSIEHLLLVTVAGGLDGAQAATLRLELEDCVDRIAFVILDLQGIESCTEEAATLLVGAAAFARGSDVDVIVVVGAREIHQALVRADVGGYLRFTDTP